MIGLVLLYVGAVLIINGLSMMGYISRREATIMNIFTGIVSLSVSAHEAFSVNTDASIKNAAFGLLFGFTYLWVAYNNLTQNDGRGLGWFSLFVSITAAGIFINEWSNVQSFRMEWLAINWAVWSLLWLSFFILGVVNKSKSWMEPVGAFAIFAGVVTAWVPGFLLLTNQLL